MKKLTLFYFLICSIATFASEPSQNEKLSKPNVDFKSPKGNWMADVEINLTILIIKTVKCDRSSDAVCVKKTDKYNGGIVLQSVKNDGTVITLCEGKLLESIVTDDNQTGIYKFDANEYIGYNN